MPANKKYLSSSTQRFAKITAGIIGGYALTLSFFIALALWTHFKDVLFTMVYGGFLLWAILLIFAFLAKNGWKIWALYLALTLIFSALAYLGQLYNPIS